MIINTLPDPYLSSKPSGSNGGNVVINAFTNSRYYYPVHTTPFLLAANFKGTGNYRVNRSPVFIDQRFFYFLNEGDELEINFEQNKPLETILLLFSNQLMKAVAGYESQTTKDLLDMAPERRSIECSIPSVPIEYTPTIIRHLNRLRIRPDDEDQESVLFELLDDLWILKGKVIDGLDKIKAKRKSTREEIYKRLLLAKLYMHDNFNIPLTVDAIAKEACLNKFHFLKLFRTYFGVSPHHYLVGLKLEEAYKLLAAGGSSVFEVCCAVGFESQGTFANLFKRTYGFSPSQLRHKRGQIPNIE